MAEEKLEIVFDLDTLEVGDLECIEEATGKSGMGVLQEMSQRAGDDEFTPDAKLFLAVVWIVLRKKNPAATIGDARRVKISSLTFKKVDPTVPAPEPAPEISPTPLPELAAVEAPLPEERISEPTV